MASSTEQPEPVPIDLGTAFQAGATLGGYAVRSLVIETTDGRKQSVELPVGPRVDEPEDDGDEIALTPTQAKVCKVFRDNDPDERLVTTIIVRLVDAHPSATKRALAGLSKIGVLQAAERVAGYARGPKFDRAIAE